MHRVLIQFKAWGLHLSRRPTHSHKFVIAYVKGFFVPVSDNFAKEKQKTRISSLLGVLIPLIS